jgi:hypothetical protein
MARHRKRIMLLIGQPERRFPAGCVTGLNTTQQIAKKTLPDYDTNTSRYSKEVVIKQKKP